MRVGALLIALALVPVLGIGWLATRQVADLSQAQDNLAVVEQTTADLLRLTEAEAALLDENYWAEAVGGLEGFQIPDALVRQFLGVDLDEELGRSRAESDRAFLLLADPIHLALFEEIRARVASGDDAAGSYEQLIERLRSDIGLETNEVFRAAAQLDNGGDLVQATKTLERATLLRASFRDGMAAYFGTLIPIGGGSGDPHFDLIANTTIYHQEAVSLGRSVDPDSAAGAAWIELENHEASKAIRLAMDAQAADIVGQGFSEDLDQLSLESVGALASVFGLATESAAQHVVLIEAATADISAHVADARTETERTELVVRGGSLAVVALTLLSAFILTRSIGRPLRDLAESADALRSGRDILGVPLRGPAEVRSAAAALNEASAHLRQAEGQALALADGRLDDLSLDLPVESRLGVSLQTAVERLRDSMGEREQYRLRLAHQASHDGLTGVPNRGASIAHLGQALARSRRAETQVAVLFVDLDGFKQVNDHHGHPTGDRLLEQIAKRLADACREGDLVGRLGGDEFLLVAEPVSGAQEALELAERMRRAVSEPIVEATVTLNPSASIGVALSDGSLTADELIRDADLAVYQAKQHGRGRTELCDEELRTRLLEEADLEQAIRVGLAKDDFELFHQPIVDARTGQPQSIEALVRWHREGVGLVLPDRFIPLAEQSQLIIELDRWVLDRAARQLSEWATDPVLGAVRMAVNISGRHLVDGNLLRDVTTVLERWAVPADKLTLELTESALLDDLTTAADSLVELQALGVQIAIDDFGTGFTSLAHLRNLPADILKIDRSFTASLDRPEDLSLVKLIIEAGHMLGLEVTAEGVETVEQATALRDLGIDTLQGYLFGRPVPAGDVRPDLGRDLTKSG